MSSDCGQAPAFEELVDGLAGEEARVGIVKDAKAKIARVEAARALSEGHAVFVNRCAVPACGPGSSGSVSGAAEVLV